MTAVDLELLRTKPTPLWQVVDGSQVCAQVDPDVFFPEKGQPTGPARNLCLGDGTQERPRCPFIVDCIHWAVHNERAGVWGGTTWEERRDLRRALGIHLPKDWRYSTTPEAIARRAKRAEEVAA